MNNLDEIEKMVHERKISNIEIVNILKRYSETNINFEALLIKLLDSFMLKPDRSSKETLEIIKKNIK